MLTGERNVLQKHVHFDHSHVLLSFLYPVIDGYGASHIYIFRQLHAVIPLRFLLS